MKERIKGVFTKKKIFHFLKMALFVVALSLILLSLLGTVAHATGLVDDTINAENLYSKYPLSNYQLDFFVDNSWSWLPWNWLDGIGKSVQYGLYCITNFVWTISLYLSNATGYVVQEAYKLDFINDMADSIGKSIQTLAGVTENGFSSTGFYVGFLLLIILVVGMYVAYTGLIKRETSKALHAVINFVVVFVLSASFIAYAPDYIKKINEFSSDISTASLDLGTKIMLPNSDSEGKDSVDLIRDSLFSIQVEQPWLLLQFGNSNAEEIGTDRVEALVSASPEDEDGKTREEVVKTEIEDNDNNNLTIPQVVNRLGMVFFLLFFNLGITIFVFLLTGMMLFSQILFIIFAMFLPISFLLSMIPSYESMAKQAIVRVFNTIMTRAGITLIVTVAFSISSMFYNISTDYPFFMVAFLQIVCFAGIYMKLGDLMSMFSLNAGDSQSMGRRIFRRPYLFMRHRARRMEHRIARAVSAGGISGGVAGAVAGSAVAGKRAERKNTASKENRGNARVAQEMGTPPENIIIGDVGRIIELTPHSAQLGGTVPSGRVFVDGYGVGDVGSVVLRDRRHLAQDGMIVVVVSLSGETGELVSGPDIITRGFVYVKESESLMEELREVALEALDACQSRGIGDWATIKSAMKGEMSRYLYKKTKRNPMILPVIMEV